MTESFDGIVAGGGLIGLVAAFALAQKGYKIAILEAKDFSAKAPDRGSRVFALTPASQNFLEQLGLWKILDPKTLSPYRYMKIWDYKTKASVDFQANLIASPCLGYMIEEIHLKEKILAAVQNEPNITLFPQALIQTIQEEDFVYLQSSNQTWKAKMLFIADGPLSSCRRLLQINKKEWSYHQLALTCKVHTEQAHQKTAYQAFHPEGTLALLPLPAAHEAGIVWSIPPKQAQALMHLEKAAFEEALGCNFDFSLGKMSLIGTPETFPLYMRHTEHYVGKKWLIFGDAAHTFHPMAGLGFNSGLEDIKVFMDCLARSSHASLSSQQVLGAYQRQRKYAVWQLILLLESLKMLFTLPLPGLPALRNFGLKALDRCHPLKRLCIEFASGHHSS